ncbi:MAG: WD40/YVTN/BNR-like repeat-containing protein [Bryobacteraceae bacterium]
MRLAVLALLTLLPASAVDKWSVAYQYDEDESSLFLRAVEFPSDRRGIAIGVLTERGRVRPVALVTANGGESWDPIRLKEEPLSLACFTDEVCWISTPKGVWRTDEGGREWKKISGAKIIMKMKFVSPTQGWAAGANKSAWETKDGGKTWTLLPVLKEVKANPEYANFLAVAMDGNDGMIGGNSRPPRRDDSLYPDWMIPEEVSKRREWPGMMILLETRDAGKTWTPSTNSVFGTLTAIHMRPEGGGAAALLEYFHTFETPAEVLFVDFKTGRSRSIFRDKTTAVTDVLLGANGAALVTGVEATGLRTLPIPQRVRFLEATINQDSASFMWTKMDVDYRATARRVHLARKPNGQFWAITDTGMILRLDREIKSAK